MSLRSPTPTRLVRADLAVDRWAQTRPTEIALRDHTSALTWSELRIRVTGLATKLITEHSVRPGEVVGVRCGRGVGGVVAVLAVLRAGAAFLPLDPNAPNERLAPMLAECGTRILLVDQDSLSDLDVDQVLLPGEEVPVADETHLPQPGLDDLAYVIYTSGSTGTPKGVQVPHQGIANLATAHVDLLDIGPTDVALNYAAMSFDGFVFELFVPLVAGATIVLPDEETRLDPVRLTRLLADTGVTFAPIPPSLLATLPVTELPALRAVLVAGDTCRPEVARRWAEGRMLFNSYGPTEGTVSATLARFQGTVEDLHIGSPFANVQVHLLDEHQRPVPPGTVGEIYIGGIGVSWGYLGQPALTAARFVPDPFTQVAGGRMYRTGDLGRLRAKGGIDFLGRRDRQLKIRGFRVEPGEVEAVLLTLPEIHEVIVVARADAAGDARLLAYVTAAAHRQVDPALVRAVLAERLPRGHVPDVVIVLPKMPRNAARKIDADRLPEPAAETEAVPQSTDPVEQVVADVVAETLGLPGVVMDTKFFDLGGNSLLMMRVVAQVNELFDAEVSVRDFAAAPTVTGLAESVRRTAAPDRLVAVAEMAEELAAEAAADVR